MRSVPELERRLAEAARLAFTRAIVPGATGARSAVDLQVVPVYGVAEGLFEGLVPVDA